MVWEDVFTLQSRLEHSTLEMVQHFARVAQWGVDQVRRIASAADIWHL